jgi:phosphoribosylanthranilate isomerase
MIFKVCGMKESGNLQELQRLAPDWIGFIFYEKSPRNVALIPELSSISAKKIGVFVDAEEALIREKIKSFSLDGLQFHGSESPSVCAKFRNEEFIVIKSFAIDDHFSFEKTANYEQACDYFLFDTKIEAASGGTGKSFDWSLLENYAGETPFILSGGINLESVADLKSLVHPKWAGIDINSRFEISPGMKNINLIQHFKDAIFG